ncbi:MAG TPA: hypothetical protein VFE46_16060 [Pirellulales bacterium]|nr:hypothetical protein [Pirellulales bacterium]
MSKPRLAIVILICGTCFSLREARGQRVEFPTPAPSAAYPSGPAVPPPTFDPYSIPSTAPPMSAPALPPAAPYGAPGAYSPYAPAPAPLYGTPYNGAPAALYPDGVPVYNGPTFAPITDTWTKTMRFFQEIHADETWLARGGGETALGINTINVWAAFAIPFYWNPNPLLITPGFQLNLWDGPDPVGQPVPFGPDLPAQTYGAYIDAAWNPQISNWFGAELEVSPGLYTDFQHTSSESIRILARGLGVLTLTPTMQFKLGVWYLDRNLVKMLPAGGIVWTPNADSRYEIFFPAPKLAHRCSTVGNHTLWAYIRGEYGGGAWTINRPGVGSDDFDYNDLRFAIGLDVLPETQSGMRGYVEVGYAFDRRLVFRSNNPGNFDLSDTVLLGAGISY